MLSRALLAGTNGAQNANVADPGFETIGAAFLLSFFLPNPVRTIALLVRMRLARVLLTSSSAPVPVAALERDGCLYDVGLLLDLLGLSAEEPASASVDDFFGRVFALRCAGLEALDERLFRGDRPSAARLSADDVVWLAPCLPERALWVALSSAPLAEAPRYHLGNARSLLGHQASVAFPSEEPEPSVDISIAALIGDDLYNATAEEAERAILGYSILLGFEARSEAARSGACRGRDFGAILGPVLVTKDEAGPPVLARARMRVRGEVVALPPLAADAFTIAESVAFISQHISLAPGDVVSAAPFSGANDVLRRFGVGFGETIEVAIDRLGKVAGRPVRGPIPPPYRAVVAS